MAVGKRGSGAVSMGHHLSPAGFWAESRQQIAAERQIRGRDQVSLNKKFLKQVKKLNSTKS